MRPFLALCLCLSLVARADEAVVAVATNFSVVLIDLKPRFEERTGHRLTIAAGSTGKLYAQIASGAPFDVFLSADQARPILLENSGLGVAATRFTYATGRLALFVSERNQAGADLRQTLRAPWIRRFAIANPALAPYGAAARDTLQSLDVWETLSARIVMGENIGQAFALVATGNADAGLVALSGILTGEYRPGRYLEVPPELHTPIRQDAILLAHGAGNAAARALLAYLRNDPAASARIAAFGYGGQE